MKTYEIKHEPVNGIDKYNIYYYENDVMVTKEFYAYDLAEPQNEIKKGYTLKEN
jgi:hypothetical protein